MPPIYLTRQPVTIWLCRYIRNNDVSDGKINTFT
jgi:hypothetical protein